MSLRAWAVGLANPARDSAPWRWLSINLQEVLMARVLPTPHRPDIHRAEKPPESLIRCERVRS